MTQTRAGPRAVRPAQPLFFLGSLRQAAGLVAGGAGAACLGPLAPGQGGQGQAGGGDRALAALLGMPDDYRLAIVPASDTGAVEMAMWSLLGARGVDVLAWESFGQGWADGLPRAARARRPAGPAAPATARCPTSARSTPDRDVVFTWNGTTSGVRVPGRRLDRRPSAQGLAICDATSAVFAMDLPWDKLDVVTWSWQKVLGGEAAHGMLALSPRAVERLESHRRPGRCPSSSA